ncbi:MAG: 4-(cytidine 5'-diphospho)-2-C-methyl-D-erythritol kinase [Gammaproteobacteria bacterium]|jgi:4-diphosphocytidyl-2-C-methyl-D-erythritol kinase|nr:4-(cytidine 5'-diphospho)-2-C-methyl-D-erythritol kinase [Gammaproteobacteria bacterium]MDH5172078.1 4-(cytidine 5'-diphospho)-2-C-methyl-D-erythritol kinase [Gammaproteobacteria bacterium]
MASTLTLLSPAKLNLFLHITGRRPDGYHELQTLFQLLDWGDWLEFTPGASGEISLAAPGLDIPPADNLIYRAARLLQDAAPARELPGIHIRVDKRIPAGAGLGGGSSNAATTLLALNRLWQLGLTRGELQALGATLGADVPVFVGGHTAWAEGIGEVLTPVDLPERWYLVITPDCHVSTGQIFSHLQLTRNTAPIKMATFFEGYSRNDCQELVRRLYPDVDAVFGWLERFAPARLTGTGASVFASFGTEAEAGAVLRQLPQRWAGVTARGLNTSPVNAYLY